VLVPMRLAPGTEAPASCCATLATSAAPTPVRQ